MKKIKPEFIFNTFYSDDSEVYKELDTEDILEDDCVLLGMAVKGIKNYYILDEIYRSNFSEKYNELSKGVKATYFNKMFNYLSKIKFNRLENLLDFSMLLESGEMDNCFKDMLEHYTYLEDYEKCAFILKIQKIFKNLNIC
jgi:hypothetical protein